VIAAGLENDPVCCSRSCLGNWGSGGGSGGGFGGVESLIDCCFSFLAKLEI